MRLLVIALLVLSLTGAGGVEGAAAQEASAVPDSMTAAEADSVESGSWLTRTLHRYFGSRSQPGDELQGKAVEIVDSYAPFVGKTIAVVLVHQVQRFDTQWDAEQGTSQQLLNSVTKPLYSYTKDRLIREYLLFEQGQAVDPFLLADSERMLRNLDYINDARIILVPLVGKPDSVVVVVETRDNWPFGLTGTVKDVNRYDVNLYFSNIGGYGFRLDNKAIYYSAFEPNLGYQGRLYKDNIRGSFIGMRLLYEDSWQQLSRQMEFQRSLVHPGIKWLGGVYWEYTDVRDNAGVPRKFELGDYWLGHTIRLTDQDAAKRTSRPVLVPAVRFRKNSFKVRPEASADSNTAYLNTKDYLVGLTYQRLEYFKTSHLFKMGETENMPSGYTIKLSGGYQDREVYERVSSFFQASAIGVHPRGNIFMGLVHLGGYFHDRYLEDGSLHTGGVYISRMMGGNRYRHRFYATLFYTLAFNRFFEEALVLGNKTGLRGLDDNKVQGNQRMILKLESRLFTPWTMMGFRFMVFGYADVGAVGGAKDVLVQQKIYSSLGLGFRIDNPDLVLPSTQVRVGFVNSVEQNGFVLGFNLGKVDYPEINIPSTRPGPFDFR